MFFMDADSSENIPRNLFCEKRLFYTEYSYQIWNSI